jgi:transposase
MTIRNKHTLNDYDFVALSRSAPDKNNYQRLMILAYLKEGKTHCETAKLLYISSQKVSAWLKRFRQDGLEGLKDKPRSGRPRLLDSGAHETLKEKIEQSQAALSGGRLRGEDIIQLIKDEWGVSYSQSGIYYLMKDIGMSWISARSKHPKQDEDAQATFKKTLLL